MAAVSRSRNGSNEYNTIKYSISSPPEPMLGGSKHSTSRQPTFPSELAYREGNPAMVAILAFVMATLPTSLIDVFAPNANMQVQHYCNHLPFRFIFLCCSRYGLIVLDLVYFKLLLVACNLYFTVNYIVCLY